MIFNSYYSPMDRGYGGGSSYSPQTNLREPVLEYSPMPMDQVDQRAQSTQPIVSIKELGQSVPEGNRFGTFIQSMQNAIRAGAGTVELATNMGGGQEPVGAEAYGREARRELREIAQINEIDIKSIHAPSNIPNLSGYNQQERGFSDEFRKSMLEEVKKAIDFSADVAGGGAVVVHTGEYQRDMTESKWNKMNRYGDYEFTSYDEEQERQVQYMVDERTGKLIAEVRKSQILHEPEFRRKPNPRHGGREEYVGFAKENERADFVDGDGTRYKFLSETDPEDLFDRIPEWDGDKVRFKSERLTWDDFVKRSEDWNKLYPRHDGRKWKPEEAFFFSQLSNQILQARGSSLYHGRFYPQMQEAKKKLLEAREFYKKLDDSIPEEKKWEMLRDHYGGGRYGNDAFRQGLIHGDKLSPLEIIDKELEELSHEERYTHEASASGDARAEIDTETLKHVVPIEEYAKKQTSKSYAEAGVYAMMQSKNNPHAKRDVFVAPENIFPEMGYGSHPEELIELVQNGRKEMIKYLTEKYIDDPKGGRDENGNLRRVPNPHYMGISKDEAQKLAKKHIKATFDTQHLGMWWKHFTSLPGETVDQRRKRFNTWYMDQVKKMEESEILGHLHIVDGIGAGHHHLPAGQGEFPVVEAVKYLKNKGYTGSMISEGYAEDQYSPGRILTETWRAFGNNVIRDSGLFSIGGGGMIGGGNWNSVRHSYFGMNQAPYFVFQPYAPSNDWSLWSEVPME